MRIFITDFASLKKILQSHSLLLKLIEKVICLWKKEEINEIDNLINELIIDIMCVYNKICCNFRFCVKSNKNQLNIRFENGIRFNNVNLTMDKI